MVVGVIDEIVEEIEEELVVVKVMDEVVFVLDRVTRLGLEVIGNETNELEALGRGEDVAEEDTAEEDDRDELISGRDVMAEV